MCPRRHHFVVDARIVTLRKLARARHRSTREVTFAGFLAYD
jgi:hypothetical protein